MWQKRRELLPALIFEEPAVVLLAKVVIISYLPMSAMDRMQLASRRLLGRPFSPRLLSSARPSLPETMRAVRIQSGGERRC